MDSKDNIIKGMVAGVFAFMMLAVMNVFAKLLSDTHHVIEIAFYRNLIAVMPFLFMIFVLGKRDILKINSRKKGVVARAVIGTVSLVVTFAAFAAMPMADVTAFLFTSSLVIPILGFFFLGEKVGLYRWSAVLVGFVGVVVMLNPSGAVNVVGVTLALSAATMHAVLQTILRYLGKTEKPETITFYFVAIGTVIAAIPIPWLAVMPTWSEVPLIIGLGFSGLAAQYLLSVAFGNAPAAVVTVFNYSGIIWSTIFGWMIWNDWPAQTIWIGGAIVIASNIFIVWRESRHKKVTGARVRAKF
jgi:drug/metabolite transporter (DMT)-like permease